MKKRDILSYLLLGVLAAQALHEGAALLKLAERGGMKPHVALLAAQAVEHAPRVALPRRHEPCLFVEQGGYAYAQHIETDSQRIHVAGCFCGGAGAWGRPGYRFNLKCRWRGACVPGSPRGPGKRPAHTCRGLCPCPPGTRARRSTA